MAFEFLLDLTESERRELEARLMHERQTAKAIPLTPDDHIFWGLLWEAIDARPQPLAGFVERFGRARWDAARTTFEELIDESLPTGVRRPVKEGVKKIALKCLADYLRARGVPISARSLLAGIDLTHTAIDQHYPGYISAHMLHHCVHVLGASLK